MVIKPSVKKRCEKCKIIRRNIEDALKELEDE